MKKVFSTAAVLLAASALFAGCNEKDKLIDDKTGGGTSVSQDMNDTMPTDSGSDIKSSETGDVDGDGFLEELGTDINEIVDDVVTGAENVADDALDAVDGR